MAELTLISSYNRSLQPLVHAALSNEVRLLESGIRRTQRRLDEYETKHKLSTNEFIRRFELNEFDETLDLLEWIGEHRMLESLQEERTILQGIKFAN